MKVRVALLLAAAAGALAAPALRAESRVALVVGCGDYQQAARLPNAPQDAAAVKGLLEGLGFEVIHVEDPGIDAFYEGLTQFRRRAGEARMGLFYFAGHGVEVEGVNYLLPVDAALDQESQLRTQAVRLDAVLDEMKQARLPAKMVILDCCRDNPLTRSWIRTRSAGSGMAEVREENLPEATMIMFAAAPGKPALDGSGAHSPFTEALLADLGKPGLSAFDAFLSVSDAVARTTGERQVPWIKFDGAGRAFRSFTLAGERAARTETAMLTRPTPAPVRVERAEPPEPAGGTPATASKERPFVNSLGMEFVPAGTPGVLFCRWETRVKDFSEFVERGNYDMSGGIPAFTLERGANGPEWKQAGGSWRDPRFPAAHGQSEDHPVVCVSLNDAKEFCSWLTAKERREGLIPSGARYALPTDEQWSAAAGGTAYPWGDDFPPGPDDGNYCGVESKVGAADNPNWGVIAGLHDGHARTAPVGSYRPNRFGLCDMGGNVWEWCDSYYKASMNSAEARKKYPVLNQEKAPDGTPFRVLRGASWLWRSTQHAFRFSRPRPSRLS